MLWFSNFTIFVILLILLKTSRSQTRDDQYHECLRPCVNEVSSKKLCRYDFFVSELPTTISTRNESTIKGESVISNQVTLLGSFLGINGKSPGPRIEICLGDTIEVFLYNRLGSQELSLHWHGLQQKGSSHMDGVSMVTQCSILPFGGFRYKLKPKAAGTYMYYAYLVSQQGDGVYGSLTVRGPQDDPSLERILLLSSRPPTLLSWHSHLHPPTPSELLLNGQSNGTVLEVDRDRQYLLRLINANAYNCPVRLSISGHDFRVVAVDSNSIQSVTGRHIVAYPGERFDIFVETNQPSGKYLIDIKGLQECRNLRQEAFIFYNDAKLESTVMKDQELLKIDDDAIVNKGFNCHEITKNFICALDLKGSKETLAEIDTNDVIYIPFDVNAFPSVTDEMTDNRYHIYGCAFYPAYLSTNEEGIRVAQINGMSFKYPSSPLLSQPENISEESICSLETRSQECADTPLFCECIQIIEVPPRKSIEIVLIDEGFGGNVSHIFHIHGYNASVVGRNSFEQAITKDEIMDLDRNGKLHRNLINPPRKDSFVVPNKGYVILRLFTDNLGYWLWEARSTAISPGTFGSGMQFLLKVGNRESFVPVPLDFPTCGNNKRPDMVFETN
ncbi:laccase-4-like [Colletes gigas]|uniref:laccase-4-like n=1 Tax=Colletes gigas TaxID=935657 RepID=UPI001C9B3ADF|nr:laccase-4-like [Colletes gigas]